MTRNRLRVILIAVPLLILISLWYQVSMVVEANEKGSTRTLSFSSDEYDHTDELASLMEELERLDASLTRLEADITSLDDSVNTFASSLESKMKNVPLSDYMQGFILARCEEYDLDYNLVLAVIRTESNFNPDSISSTSDYGLMQINHRNHEWLTRELGVTDFLNPEQNVMAGIHMLAGYSALTGGNLHRTLMYYNMGPSRTEELWFEGITSSEYSRLVLSRMETLVTTGSFQ